MDESEDSPKSALQSVAESRWYRYLLRTVYPFFLGTVLLSFFGVPDWPIIRNIPESWVPIAVIAGFLISGPALVLAIKQHTKKNLEKYDPESPEIQNVFRWLRKVGWSFALLTGAIFFLVIFLTESEFEFVESDLFIYLAAGALILCISVSIYAFHTIGHIKSGMTAPPKWLLRLANADEA